MIKLQRELFSNISFVTHKLNSDFLFALSPNISSEKYSLHIFQMKFFRQFSAIFQLCCNLSSMLQPKVIF